MAKIIIIDDSETVTSQLRTVLEGAGHTVLEANNGIDGYEMIVTTDNPDLVIADYNMPGLDGVAMLAKVREKFGTIPCPVFIMTSGADTVKPTAKKIGVTAWIIKPFNAAKLLSAVNGILPQKAH